jgi:hypothetical protein
MHRYGWATALTALALLLTGGAAEASRVGPTRTVTSANPGARPDGYVPYTINGKSNFGVDGGAPRIYASPAVTNPGSVQIAPVYNLPFYGAVRAFGTMSDGATPRPPLQIRPR